jgi:hypothetical protein
MSKDGPFYHYYYNIDGHCFQEGTNLTLEQLSNHLPFFWHIFEVPVTEKVTIEIELSNGKKAKCIIDKQPCFYVPRGS